MLSYLKLQVCNVIRERKLLKYKIWHITKNKVVVGQNTCTNGSKNFGAIQREKLLTCATKFNWRLARKGKKLAHLFPHLIYKWRLNGLRGFLIPINSNTARHWCQPVYVYISFNWCRKLLAEKAFMLNLLACLSTKKSLSRWSILDICKVQIRGNVLPIQN